MARPKKTKRKTGLIGEVSGLQVRGVLPVTGAEL